MIKHLFLLFTCFLYETFSLFGQCTPDRNGAWNHILDIIDSQKISYKEKTVVLLGDLEKMNNCPYKNDSTHAFLLQIIAEAYFRQSDFLNAVSFYRQSIDMITANTGKPFVNPKRLISNYYWLSVAYNSLNNVSGKMKAVNQCIDMALLFKSFSDMNYIRALYERVKYSFDMGDYHSCIADAGMCESLARNYLKTVSVDSYEYSTGRFIATSSLGWYVKALKFLNNFVPAGNFLADKPEEYKKAGLEKYLGFIYSELADVQVHNGDYKKADSLYRLAIRFARKAGDDFACMQILNTVGHDVYFNYFKDGDRALNCYRNALACCNKDKARSKKEIMESLNIFAGMANVHVQKGDFDSAFSYYQLAIDQVKDIINEKDFSQISPEKVSNLSKLYYIESLLIDWADAFIKKYRVSKQTGDIREAIVIYKNADQLLDKVRVLQSEMESKLFWLKDSRRLYEHAINACYLLGNTTDAFYFFEKSRAVLLNDQLKEQHLMDAEEISNLVQVKTKIAGLENELTSLQAHSGRYAEVQSELFAGKQERGNLEQLIKMRYPLYFQGLDTNYMSPADVQKKILIDHQALLEIFSGDSAVYTLLLTSRQIYFNKIPKDDIEKVTASYISYISNRDLQIRDFAGFRNMSHQLYLLIFQNNPVPKGRIIISPSGNYFPFESLVSDNSLKDPVYFLADHAVSYTYSARYLANDFASTTTASSGNLLGIAPVQYPPGFHLPALANSDLSLQKIENYFKGSHKLVEKNASKNNFLQLFPEYKIIQLYTHSSDSSNRNEPVIYFADSSLYLSSLFTDKIPATRLIVLSACETGNGTLYQGEGVFSFNRGFAALGIPSSVSNLWSVDNISTYQVTEHFYKYLSEGLPFDVALQKAKLEYMSAASGEYKLPYYWAPSVLTGKSDSIEQNKKSFPWKTVLLLLAVAGLILWGWDKYKNHRQIHLLL
jgi:tetratricopeptide (TPR) repeat protein